MTVIDRFFNWQRSGLNWDAPPYESCSPALMSLQTWLLNMHGGQSLGCHGDRPIRAGTEPSSHAFGAALDWRYENPGPGRRYALDVVLPFVLAHSDELGVQAIHDYAGDRIWRPPGHSGRLVGSDGWKAQNGAGGQMGESWALWFHFEIHPDDFDDARTVEIKTTFTPPTITEDCNMIAIDYTAPSGQWTALTYTGSHLAHVRTSEADAIIRRAGVQRQTVTAAELDALILSAATTTHCPLEWVNTARGAAWTAQRA